MNDARVALAVIGAGPAGWQAALTAAACGVAVAVVDDHQHEGGQYARSSTPSASLRTSPSLRSTTSSARSRTSIVDWQADLTARPTLLSDTLVWGVFPSPEGDGWLLALQAGPGGQSAGPQHLHARALVVAAGAYERPVAFPGWTLPGVIMAGGAQIMLRQQGVLPGQRILLAGSGPLQLAVAASLVQAGAKVAAVLEAARVSPWRWLRHGGALWGQGARLKEGWAHWRTLRDAGVPILLGRAVAAARGHGRVEEAMITRLDRSWRPIPGSEELMAVDTILLGYGLIPSTQITRLLGCRHIYERQRGGWAPVRDPGMQTTCAGVYAAGDGAGVGGARLAQIEGAIAGWSAVAHLGYIPAEHARRQIARLQPALRREQRFARLLAELFTPRSGLYALAGGDRSTLICRCEEVTAGELQQAAIKGATTLTEAKNHTRAGMGSCQGRMCADLIARVLAGATNIDEAAYIQSVAAAGAFGVRPPLYPLTLAELASHCAGQPSPAQL